jgi:16S rRNA (adenine1518-N6/adenine1519-N6)-dimethyltransferase
MEQDLLTETKAALNALSIRPHSLRGQNFLVSREMVARIIGIHPFDQGIPVLEIGSGLGSLTFALAEQVSGQLDLLEIEPLFAQRLTKLFAERSEIDVHQADALTFDYQALYQDKPYLIYANVPYNITTPLLKKLILEGGNWQRMVLMLQKEAAERISMGAGRDNGPLTLLLAAFADSEICFEVPKEAFYPMPAIESAVMQISRKKDAVADSVFLKLYQFIEAAFAQRRKTLVNSLIGKGYGGDRAYWQELLKAAQLPANIRAEALSLADFEQLFALHTCP